MSKSNNQNNQSSKLISIIAGVLLIFVIGSFVMKEVNNKREVETSKTSTTVAQLSETGDMVIPIADVTEDANFYEFDADGTTLEVIAVKASDGTIRTAFNTCQVCFSSGRGYYKQDGKELVCQNCKNRFSFDEVEVTKGGCNPVPIDGESKTVDSDNITISKEYLIGVKELFSNWKL